MPLLLGRSIVCRMAERTIPAIWMLIAWHGWNVCWANIHELGVLSLFRLVVAGEDFQQALRCRLALGVAGVLAEIFCAGGTDYFLLLGAAINAGWCWCRFWGRLLSNGVHLAHDRVCRKRDWQVVIRGYYGHLTSWQCLSAGLVDVLYGWVDNTGELLPPQLLRFMAHLVLFLQRVGCDLDVSTPSVLMTTTVRLTSILIGHDICQAPMGWFTICFRVFDNWCLIRCPASVWLSGDGWGQLIEIMID